MSEFKSIILGICIASVSLGAMYMIRPSGNITKIVRFGFAVIFLTLTLSLVISFFSSSKKKRETFSYSTNFYGIEEIAAVEARYIVSSILNEKNIKFSEIDIFTNKDDSGGISIKRITIKTNENPDTVRDSINAVIESGGVEVINE